MGHLWAGVGRSDLTPAPGTPQGGWGAQTHQRGLGADMPFSCHRRWRFPMVTRWRSLPDVDAIGFDAEWTDKIISSYS